MLEPQNVQYKNTYPLMSWCYYKAIKKYVKPYCFLLGYQMVSALVERMGVFGCYWTMSY